MFILMLMAIYGIVGELSNPGAILPGVVGLLEAVETIKILLGIGTPLVSRLLVYDALEATFTELQLRRDPECRWCGDGRPFPGYVDYEAFCSSRSAQL